MAAKVPILPLTRTAVLGDFKRAIKRRSKAIKHSVIEWTLERAVSREDGYDVESLRNFWQLHRGELSVCLWEDGIVRVYARDLIAKKVAFEFAFYASLGDANCDELVSVMENSTTPICVREMYKDAKSELLKLWAPFGPYQADHGRV